MMQYTYSMVVEYMAGPASVEGCPELPAHLGCLFRLAELDPRRAVALARRWHAATEGASTLDRAVATYSLGYTLLRWERLSEAAPLLAAAAARLHELARPRLHLHARRAAILVRLLLGSGSDDSSAWGVLAEAYTALNDPLSVARVRLGQIAHLNLQGLSADALRLADGVRPMLEMLGTSADQAWLARLAGVSHVALGDFIVALAQFDLAAGRFASLRQRGELAKTMIERSHIYERSGELARCGAELEQALRLVRRIDLPLRVAFCTKNLGWIAALQGEYDRGIWLSLVAHDQFERLARPDALADCDLNLGNIAYFANLPELALAAYGRAERVYTTLSHRRMLLVVRRNQALALRLGGQPSEALARLDVLIPQARQLHERVVLAESTYARGQALADLGRHEEATTAFAEGESQFRAIGNLGGAGRSLLERGWLLFAQGHIALGEVCFAAAGPLLQGRPVHLWRVEYGLGSCAERRGDRGEALTHYRAACLTVGRLRQRLANEHASSGLFAQAQRLIEAAIGLAWRQGAADTVLELAELQRAVALTAALRISALSVTTSDLEAIPLGPSLVVHLEARLRDRRLRPLDEAALLAPLDLPELRVAFAQAFPAGWALLAYVPCGDQLLIVTLDADSVGLTATPFDARLRWLLERTAGPRFRWMTYLDTDSAGGWPILDELGARLFPATVLAASRPERRLLLVAGGALHSLPWAALRVEGHWLIERATPQLLPGLQHWRELAARPQGGAAALGIGVAEFGERAPSLPGVRASLDALVRHWPGPVSLLEGAAVQVEALLREAAAGHLRAYGLIHVASHGQIVPASGLYAHLKLSDGDLHYDEVARLNLAGALVVLAACEGAAVETLPGEEVLSLSRALLIAGARDVVASIWQLFDPVAPLLLDRLYAALADGLDAPAALAQAQRAWLDDPELAALGRAPLVWAGLCALGVGSLTA